MEIFSNTYWKDSQIIVFHCGEKNIILGNNETQVELVRDDNIYIKESVPSEIGTLINMELVNLNFYKNYKNLINIFEKYFVSKTIEKIKDVKFNICDELYLDKEVLVYKFPLDKEKLFSNIKKNSIYENCNMPTSIIPSTEEIKNIIFKEIKDFNTNTDFNDYIEPIEDSLFKFNLYLFDEKDKCKIEINLDSNYYPMTPPKIKWIAPVISKELYADILNSKVFGSSWNPTIELKNLFLKLKEKLLERKVSNKEKIFGECDEENEFKEDDNLIIEFCKAIGNFTGTKILDLNFTTIDKSASKSKSHWKGGTGYGHNGLTKWSLEDYLKEQSNIQTQIIKILVKLDTIELSDKNKEYICKLIFQELSGISLIDINKNNNLYQSYLRILNNNFNKEFKYEKLDSWLEAFQDLIDSIKMSLEGLENKTEIENKNIIINYLSNLVKYKNKKEIIVETTDETTYCDIMKKLQFSYYDLPSKHLYNKHSDKPANPKQMMKILQEISSLQKSLPLNEESTVWLRIDKKKLTKLQFMISGPKDTPYQDGLFLFDCYFPPNYPKDPPRVLLQTTGGGKVRFNPNLYHNGKVCLSLLGTWSGEASEKWNEKTSTLLQVLVSIQSLILIEKPYFNEPGYEREIGTSKGDANSRHYNTVIEVGTAEWAIEDMIKNPPKGFEDVVMEHFKHKKESIKTMLAKWKETNKSKVFDRVITLLE